MRPSSQMGSSVLAQQEPSGLLPRRSSKSRPLRHHPRRLKFPKRPRPNEACAGTPHRLALTLPDAGFIFALPGAGSLAVPRRAIPAGTPRSSGRFRYGNPAAVLTAPPANIPRPRAGLPTPGQAQPRGDRMLYRLGGAVNDKVITRRHRKTARAPRTKETTRRLVCS